jgi:leader peptidase (prepilin peptidase)/N-methyltransferase
MTAYAVLALVAGLLIGSFLNVCIFRLPRGQSVIAPRSSCPACGHRIRSWENVPILSYLFLAGKCSQCRAPISWVYPLVETFTGLSFLLLFLKFGLTPPFFVNALFFCGLIVLIFIDLHERILPDILTLGGTIAGFALSPFQSSEILGAVEIPWKLGASLIGGVLGGGILWLVAAAYLRIKKIEGMGFGDIKMMLMVGTFLGWRLTWLTILLGSMLGALIGGGFMLLMRKGRRYELPFGSFLGLGAMLATLYGVSWIGWYFGP